MKIALLSVFYPYRGGIAQFGAQLYRSLENGNEIKAFNFKRQYPGFLFPGSTQYVGDQDQVDRIPTVRILDSISPLSYIKTAKAINEFGSDLLISQYWMTFFGPAIAGVQKRVKGQKRIAIIHNMIPHEKRFFDARSNSYFLKHTDGFVVMSDKVKEDLLSLKPDAKILRVDHPVYDQFGEVIEQALAREQLNIPKDKKVLLFFGLIRDYKGLDMLIESLSLLPEEYHLIIAGESYGDFAKYDYLIKAASLEKRVSTFLKYIPDDEVKWYFSAADVCVLPYKSATQSGVTAVSFQFDLPIIATDVGGLKETIKHGENGSVVSELTAYAVASEIETYFNEKRALKYKDSILAWKRENSWENFSAKIVEFSTTL